VIIAAVFGSAYQFVVVVGVVSDVSNGHIVISECFRSGFNTSGLFNELTQSRQANITPVRVTHMSIIRTVFGTIAVLK